MGRGKLRIMCQMSCQTPSVATRHVEPELLPFVPFVLDISTRSRTQRIVTRWQTIKSEVVMSVRTLSCSSPSHPRVQYTRSRPPTQYPETAPTPNMRLAHALASACR